LIDRRLCRFGKDRDLLAQDDARVSLRYMNCLVM
jgi:hypothetical protein